MSEQPCEWLLVKRDLYERPEHQGYTGIRDNAGLFTEEDAKSSVGDGGYGVTMVRLADAPEFTAACFDDLARAHLRGIIAAKADALTASESTVASLRAERDEARSGRLAVTLERNELLKQAAAESSRAIAAEAEVERLTRDTCGDKESCAYVLAEWTAAVKKEQDHAEWWKARAAAAESALVEAREALREVREHFRVEYSNNAGSKPAIGYDSEALPKVIAILDAARALDRSPSVEPGK